MNPHGEYRFDDYAVDLEAWQLLRSDQVVHLEPIVLKLLVFLIEHRDRLVTKDELLETVWGGTVVSESALSKAVARLRKALGDDSAHSKYIETVHSLGYRFIAEIRDTGRPEARSPPDSRRRRVRYAVLVVSGLLAMAIVLFGAGLFDVGTPTQDPAPGADRPRQINSLAVLPLDNLAGDPEQDYFVDGLQDVLIADLSKISGLKVISRQSTLRYRASDKPAPEIARELGVDALVEGGALLLDRQVKITAQLIDGRTDDHIWAQNYDRDLGDVLALLGEIARTISGEIELSLRQQDAARLASAGPADPAASEAYLQGLHHFNRFTVEGFRQSLGYFRQAVETDPGLARAWSGLAGAHLMIAYFGDGSPTEAVRQARVAALKALELDDQLADGHAALGWVRLFSGDWPGAGQAFEDALRLNPSQPMTRHGYADYLLVTGHWEESLDQVRRAQAIDPHTPGSNVPLPFHLFMMRRYDDSIAETQVLLDRDPGYPVNWLLALVYWQQGVLEESIAAYRKTLARADDTLLLAAVDRGMGDSGPRGAMLAVAGAMAARAEDRYVDPFKIASTFAHAGDVEQAFAWLEQAVERGSPELMFIGLRPDFDILRDDPRFAALMQRLGLPGDSRIGLE